MTRQTQVLTLSVHFMEGRYHGEPEWPPSPARLFQALIAGCGFSETTNTSLRWLETLNPPTVAVPLAVRGQEMGHFVPNNDLDSEGADRNKIGEIRVQKNWHPRLFNADTPVVYTWQIDEKQQVQAEQVIEMAQHLYQLGRGIDMAWATGEVIGQEATDRMLENHAGEILRPALGAQGGELSCPRAGSLDSLERRYEDTLQRFSYESVGKKRIQVFRQPAKALFEEVSYNSQPQQKLYDLRLAEHQSRFSPVSLTAIAALTASLRDAAVARLTKALPSHQAEIERWLLGKVSDSAKAVVASERVRLIPLPSIGHEHVGREIRRLLVCVPATCGLRQKDVFWAFNGLDIGDDKRTFLVEADDTKMLEHYDIDAEPKSQLWRTVTPAVLPLKAARRRIDPARKQEEAKNGNERLDEESRARAAVKQALRHAGADAPVEEIWVQREPFAPKEARVEPFAKGTRFAKEQLWHVEVRFRRAVAGPLVIGNGRFLGLGLMAPQKSKQPTGVMAFRVVKGLCANTQAEELVRAFRRAVMSRFSAASGLKNLPSIISGHEWNGDSVKGESKQISFAFDGARLLIVPPHVRECRSPSRNEQRHLATLTTSMDGFVDLRAGTQGRLSLEAMALDNHDALLNASTTWVSQTAYVVNRHQKHAQADEVLIRDVQASCRAAGLPRPKVKVLNASGISNVGLTGYVELTFDFAISGPLLIGRTRHLGGGLFLPKYLAKPVEQADF
ncbi:MAG: type I-U CRISPR-associated protein Cas5/Cas6 [Deltaproteobacteria bacterium]|nr:type I-U CRISPR-associated protein Cas5/Cas6 [Deltaproteobacteria bacterium]